MIFVLESLAEIERVPDAGVDEQYVHAGRLHRSRTGAMFTERDERDGVVSGKNPAEAVTENAIVRQNRDANCLHRMNGTL